MNYRKVNWCFLGMIMLHLGVVGLLLALRNVYSMGMVTNLLVSELILAVPAFLAVLTSREKPNRVLGFHKLKVSSVFMIILYTFLMGPLTTLLNAISMLFVDNAVVSISGEVLNLPFLLTFFLMAVFGPVCEELCFRGVVYRGYLKSGNVVGAVLLSSLLFGLMHMNFNQAPYAFAIGVSMAVLVEATGSLWSSILMHVVFNAQSVLAMYFYQRFFPRVWLEQTQAVATSEDMIAAISVYLVIAVISTALAVCVLVWLGRDPLHCPLASSGKKIGKEEGKADKHSVNYSHCHLPGIYDIECRVAVARGGGSLLPCFRESLRRRPQRCVTWYVA